ncbi:MAG: MFS transporter [Eggerthella lenta]
MSNVKHMTQVTSPPMGEVADSAKQIGGDVVHKVKKSAKKTMDDVAMTPFLRKITFFSSGGSFLDGYVLSLIGVALTQITPLFSLDEAWSAAIGASVLLGIFVGTIAGGYLTDRIGRKKMFIVDIVAIGTFSILSVFCADPLQLVAARFFIGVFVGADYPIATSLIAEFTPKQHRSISMGMVSAAWYLGATVAAFVGYFLYSVPNGWQWMLGSAVIPCIILLIGRHDIPESPMWLAQKGRTEEADAVMRRVFGEGVELELEDPGEKTSLRKVFAGGYAKRIVFLGILTLCQVVPMYAIYTFGPEIMTAFGLGEGHEAILGESVVSLFFLIGSIPAMFWLNSMGRRPLLIRSLALMAVGLVILGVFPDAPIYVIILGFGLYAFFSGGPGILQWLYPNELFPTEVRASAVGIAIAFSRIGTIIATYGTPLFLAAYGIGPTMLIAAGLVILVSATGVHGARDEGQMLRRRARRGARRAGRRERHVPGCAPGNRPGARDISRVRPRRPHPATSVRARTSRSQCPFDFLRHAIIAPPAPCDLRARPRRLLFAIPACARPSAPSSPRHPRAALASRAAPRGLRARSISSMCSKNEVLAVFRRFGSGWTPSERTQSGETPGRDFSVSHSLWSGLPKPRFCCTSRRGNVREALLRMLGSRLYERKAHRSSKKDPVSIP